METQNTLDRKELTYIGNKANVLEEGYLPHKFEPQKNGGVIISLWCPGLLQVGDILKWAGESFAQIEITEIIEHRSHRGVFKNPEHKQNTFYKIIGKPL